MEAGKEYGGRQGGWRKAGRIRQEGRKEAGRKK